MKFNIGDKVIVKNDFDEHRYDSDPGINNDMINMKNKIYTISDVYEGSVLPLYTLEEDIGSWSWSELWLEPYYEDCASVIELDEKDLVGVIENSSRETYDWNR